MCLTQFTLKCIKKTKFNTTLAENVLKCHKNTIIEATVYCSPVFNADPCQVQELGRGASFFTDTKVECRGCCGGGSRAVIS